MQRIGVFVCHCGTNIAGTVDVKAVAEALKTEPGVVFSTDYQYMCSQAGQEIIKNAIAEYKLTGIVVCSCSPRMHETTFRKAAEKAGINPYLVEIANIREHCSWIHKDMEEATRKAVILMRAAVDKVRGKRMPKLVGSHVFWKPKVAQILFQFKLDKARIHFLSGRRAQYEIV